MGNDTPAYTTAKSQLETLFQQAKAAIEKIKTTTNTESQVIQENTIADNNVFDSEQACKDTITKSGRNGLECYKESDKWKLRWTFKVGDECPKTDCSVNAEVTKCEYERVTATSFSCKVTECKTGYTVVDGVCKENQSQNNANSERNNCTKDEKSLTHKWDEGQKKCVELTELERKDICNTKSGYEWDTVKKQCLKYNSEEWCKKNNDLWVRGKCYSDILDARNACLDNTSEFKWDELKDECVRKTAAEKAEEKAMTDCFQKPLSHKWNSDKKTCEELKTDEEKKAAADKFKGNAKKCPKEKPYYRVGPNGGECYDEIDDSDTEEEIKVYTAEETDKIINDINKKYREKPLEKVEAPKPESLTRPGTTANSNPVDMNNLQLAKKQGAPCASKDPNSTGAGTWQTNGGFCLPTCKSGFENSGRNGACLKKKK